MSDRVYWAYMSALVVYLSILVFGDYGTQYVENQACEAKNGVLLKGYNKYVCVPKQVAINISN